jgi:hypothetical protein
VGRFARHDNKKAPPDLEGTEKVPLGLFNNSSLHIVAIKFGYVQIFLYLYRIKGLDYAITTTRVSIE